MALLDEGVAVGEGVALAEEQLGVLLGGEDSGDGLATAAVAAVGVGEWLGERLHAVRMADRSRSST